MLVFLLYRITFTIFQCCTSLIYSATYLNVSVFSHVSHSALNEWWQWNTLLFCNSSFEQTNMMILARTPPTMWAKREQKEKGPSKGPLTMIATRIGVEWRRKKDNNRPTFCGRKRKCQLPHGIIRLSGFQRQHKPSEIQANDWHFHFDKVLPVGCSQQHHSFSHWLLFLLFRLNNWNPSNIFMGTKVKRAHTYVYGLLVVTSRSSGIVSAVLVVK